MPGVYGIVGLIDSMVKMHLYLAQPFRLKCRKHVNRRCIVLFGRKKIGVAQGSTIMIPN
jgi:hypothetical protein